VLEPIPHPSEIIMHFIYKNRSICSLIISFIFCCSLPAYSQTSCPVDRSVCSNDVPFELTGGSPAGGSYSGTGVADGIFTPGSPGNYLITYSYTNASSQTTSCTFNILVKPIPQYTCALGIIEDCVNIGAYDIPPFFGTCSAIGSGVTTVWSGPGISVNPLGGFTFDPMIAGPGYQHATAVATLNGCSVTFESDFALAGLPAVSCPPDKEFSVAQSPFKLTEAKVTTIPGLGSPGSQVGTYSGDGVNSLTSMFDPAVAGEGAHIITFSFRNDCAPATTCTFKLKTVPFPVKLVTFEATTAENVITLQWKTAMETGFDRFEVEKSLNPKTGFAKIHEIKGSGISNTYNFSDPKSQKGVPQYYRLKMVDTDGSFAYSKIVWGLVEGAETLSVYPNPASKLLNLESATALVEVKLTNSSGVQVFSEKLNRLKIKSLALPSLAPGIYLLHTKNVNGASAFSRVMIR
jgi:hypothetical protein